MSRQYTFSAHFQEMMSVGCFGFLTRVQAFGQQSNIWIDIQAFGIEQEPLNGTRPFCTVAKEPCSETLLDDRLCLCVPGVFVCDAAVGECPFDRVEHERNFFHRGFLRRCRNEGVGNNLLL
jgi:hypothetical protein